MQGKIQRIRNLVDYLNKCRKAYYVDSKPLISDQSYDDLVDELEQLENATGVVLVNSPTQSVGYTVSDKLPKVVHDIELLSLEKTKEYEKARNFTCGKQALLMYKLDGLTICLTYENGELVEASTRGNGKTGSIITDNAKTFKNVPLKIPYKGKLKLSGEGLIHYSDFDRMNKAIEDPEERYKTPRNLTSGSVQQFDSSVCAERNVYFYAFNVLIGLEEYSCLSERLEAIKEFGFNSCEFVVFNQPTKEEFSELVEKW